MTLTLRLAIAGVTHGHVATFHRSKYAGVELVGVSERDDLARSIYARRYGVEEDLLYTELAVLVRERRPEAVAAFGPISHHLEVVEVCAPLGIHVMVEKPLATTVTDAVRIADLSSRHGIHVITNYETTWYPATQYALQTSDEERHGRLWKVVIHSGHRGPVEIGCEPEFLAWLTRPGSGGALMDFGCYGANLMTRLMRGAVPDAVIALTRTVKPGTYPHVEDDATIALRYPGVECLIEASWNWPIGRKDMELYADGGYLVAVDKRSIRQRRVGDDAERVLVLDPPPHPGDDPIAYLESVIRGRVVVGEQDLGGIVNNVQVVRILEAAAQSARVGAPVSPNG